MRTIIKIIIKIGERAIDNIILYFETWPANKGASKIPKLMVEKIILARIPLPFS